jgi:hypothetical protein
MATTPQDWRVTAAQQARCAVAELQVALDDPAGPGGAELSLADVLAHVWRGAQAAEAALGALVTAEVRAGMSWAEVAVALGLPGPQDARRELSAAIAAGDRRLRDRLPYA